MISIGGRSSVGRTSTFNDSCSITPRQLLCRRVCASWPTCMCTARTQSRAHIKDPISIYRKSVGLSSVVWKHENTAHRKKRSWVSPVKELDLSVDNSSSGPSTRIYFHSHNASRHVALNTFFFFFKKRRKKALTRGIVILNIYSRLPKDARVISVGSVIVWYQMSQT